MKREILFRGFCPNKNIRQIISLKYVDGLTWEQVAASIGGYLHIDRNIELSADQKALLLEAVRYDKEQRFSAGKSICEIFTREELEGAKAGKVFYT